MITKIKTACFLYFYSKSTSVILNIHIDNLVLQLKNGTDNFHNT